MSTKVAIVTGASSGIGEAIARRLQGLGYVVYAAARRVDRMAHLADAGIKPVMLDVTDDASMVGLVETVLAESGHIDVLVNNAGYGSYGSLEEVPLDEARRQFEVNVFGLARLTQLVLPGMRAQRSGHVVNISSMGGKIYFPLGAWYHATKFAVEGLSNSLRMEVAPFGIQVVVIEPGGIATEWGGIAGEGLSAVSGQGAYAPQAVQVAKLLASEGSSPEVVANAVAGAVSARRARTRYAMGLGAKPLIFARWLLSDRAFDRLIGFAVKSAR